jgi:thiol-disulfide isomerase/thioredoxin
MKPTSVIVACLILAAILPGSTSAVALPAAPIHHDSRPAGVAWFDGTVPEAMAAAAQSGKPVFLYWSAAWCPPCQELKATIFKRRDVLDRLSLFVPVYLDGDSQGAQSWGEHFHVSGYPTVVILRPDQTETERVNGGMDLSRYATVLSLALEDTRAKSEVLQGMLDADRHTVLSLHDCRQLAYNAWSSEERWNHPETLGELSTALDHAAAHCPTPATLERARLQLTAAQAASLAEATALGSGKPPGPHLVSLLQSVHRLLNTPTLALAMGDLIESMPASYFVAEQRLDPVAFRTYRKTWDSLLDQLAHDPRYSAADHLYAWYGRLAAEHAIDPDGVIAPDQSLAVVASINTELAREHEPQARASLVNAALNILNILHDDDRAAVILETEIRTAAHPYYYMVDLADIEEKRGHTEQALHLFAEAFQQAQGPATRFQWGVTYLRALMRLTPTNDQVILATSHEVMHSLDEAGGVHGRNARGLQRLQDGWTDWNRDGTHTASVTRMQADLSAIPTGAAAP